MEEFVLIMRHEDGGKEASPEQLQAWMKKARSLAKTKADQQLLQAQLDRLSYC